MPTKPSEGTNVAQHEAGATRPLTVLTDAQRRAAQSAEGRSTLFAALVKAQSEFTVVQKNSTVRIENKYTFKYASLDDVVAMVRPILKENGLAVLQFPSHDGEGRSTLTTYLIHESGESLSHDMLLIGVGSDPKAQGAAITYARRYALCAALGIVADEDVDAPPPVPPPEAPPPPWAVDPEEQKVRDGVYKALVALKTADQDGKGPYIGRVLNLVRVRLALPLDHVITVPNIKAWIAKDPDAAMSAVAIEAALLDVSQPDD